MEDLRSIRAQLDATERETRALVDGLDEVRGTWKPAPDAWSVAQCLDHLATADRVYLQAMRVAADEGRRTSRMRRRPAVPGLIGGLFVRMLEPPVTPRKKSRAPRKIEPGPTPALATAYADFLAAHADACAFLHANGDLDLVGIRFVNPFVRGVRFSLATGLHVIAAHERRHLWQARRTRDAAEEALGSA
jgi:hypothetical protein